MMQVARSHDLKVVEDACQAHMSEWNGKKVGSFGHFGCFSLQNSKVITCGEGGAIVGDDERMMDRAFSYHNFARPYGPSMNRERYGHLGVGTKARITEYQASILMTQMVTSDREIARREANGKYLASRLKEIPGIVPRKEYPETTRVSYYKCAFRYKKELFDGLPRSKFIQAVRAEGIPADPGLGTIEKHAQNREGTVEGALNSILNSKRPASQDRRPRSQPASPTVPRIRRIRDPGSGMAATYWAWTKPGEIATLYKATSSITPSK
jgi:dTDP-4-amino-4,6-dideoxygalactose transaminase